MATIPSGATFTVLSDGNTPNTGRYLARLSGTYTAGNVVLDATSYPSTSATRMGIKPTHVKITNLTDRISMEAIYGSTSGLLTVAAGTRTLAAHGLTFTDRSLSITAATNSLLSTNADVLIEVWA